jgi:hypothetical protein
VPATTKQRIVKNSELERLEKPTKRRSLPKLKATVEPTGYARYIMHNGGLRDDGSFQKRLRGDLLILIDPGRDMEGSSSS